MHAEWRARLMPSELPVLLWISVANALLLLLSTTLLLATLYRRQLVIHSRVYILASVLGILGCLVFAWFGSRVIAAPEALRPALMSLTWVLIPSALMAEAGIMGAIGVSGLWRLLFVLPAVLGGLVFVGLFLRVIRL